jgi:hypothetical protein
MAPILYQLSRQQICGNRVSLTCQVRVVHPNPQVERFVMMLKSVIATFSVQLNFHPLGENSISLELALLPDSTPLSSA